MANYRYIQPHSLSLQAVVRIFLRWNKRAMAVLYTVLPVALFLAFLIPLRYEATLVFEYSSPKALPSSSDDIYNLTRLTWGTQRVMTLFKTDALFQQWLQALGLMTGYVARDEREIQALRHSLKVHPTNFTTLFTLSVLAASPEEAKRRVSVLVDVFQSWEQNRVNVVSAASAGLEPVHSRWFFLLFALNLSILMAGALVFFWELRDPYVRRLGDIRTCLPSASVVVSPTVQQGKSLLPADFLADILKSTAEEIQTSGSIFIDMLGDEALLQKWGMELATELRALHYEVNVLADLTSLSAREIFALRHSCQAVIVTRRIKGLELPTVFAGAVISCVALAAGKTKRERLAFLAQQLQGIPAHKIFILLQDYEDPIADWVPAIP